MQLEGKYQVVYIRGAYNRMLFCLQVDEPIFRGAGLIIGCIFLCKGMDLYLRGGAYKWGGGL